MIPRNAAPPTHFLCLELNFDSHLGTFPSLTFPCPGGAWLLSKNSTDIFSPFLSQAGGSTGLLMDLAANEKAVHADFFNGKDAGIGGPGSNRMSFCVL